MRYKLCSLPVALFLMLLPAQLFAVQPDQPGPAVIKLKMGKKSLEFTHQKHQKLTNNQCWECHDKDSGKIAGWNKATAHKLCIPCHDLNQKGPVDCKGCHKK